MFHFYRKCLLLLLLMPVVALAASKPSTEAPSSPSWVVDSKSFAMVTFSLPAEEVKKLLPASIIPLVNDKGRVNTTLEVYNTERISGIPSYEIVFIVVDVANHPSRTGMPGHFAIWGRVDSKPSQDFFSKEFGFPYKLTSAIDIQPTANAYKASIAGELQLHIEPLRDQPFEGNGVVDMLSLHPEKGLLKTEVPFLTKGHFGNVVSLNITSKGDPLLDLLKNTKPDWSLVSDQQVFTYSPWVSVTR